jgi:hypothetical protein
VNYLEVIGSLVAWSMKRPEAKLLAEQWMPRDAQVRFGLLNVMVLRRTPFR